MPLVSLKVVLRIKFFLMNYLISIIVFQAIFSFILLASQRNKDTFEKLISLFMFFISLHLSTKLTFLVFLKNNPVYYNVPTSFSFAYGPILYLATTSLKEKITLKSILLHFSPFVVSTISFIVILFQISFYDNHGFLDIYEVFILSEIASLGIYPILSLKKLNSYNEAIKKERVKFLKILSYIFVALVSLFFIIIILSQFGLYINARLTYVFFLATSITVVLFKIKTYQNPDYVSATAITNEAEEQKYSTSNLSDSDLNNYKTKIESYFKSNKPYLDPELTLLQLSKRLDIPKHHVTQVLNTGFNKNFYQFINEYRVNAVVQKLSNSKQNENIIDIAFSCGFNSKSTFNTYFKKVTGQTPKSFKQTLFLAS